MYGFKQPVATSILVLVLLGVLIYYFEVLIQPLYCCAKSNSVCNSSSAFILSFTYRPSVGTRTRTRSADGYRGLSCPLCE